MARLVAVVAVGALMLAACQREEQGPAAPAPKASSEVVNPGTIAAGQELAKPKRTLGPGGFLLTTTGAVVT